jgi:hypothetical protein
MPALAQTTGSVEGNVVDSSGGALPGASVELKSPQLQGVRTAVTAADGHYRFPALPPGNYTVTVSMSGFKTVEHPAVRVTLDATAVVPVKLEIALDKSIVVTGEAPVVDTTSSTAGLSIRQDVVQKLPLARNYAAVIAINPGVGTDNAETQGRAMAFTIYGSTSVENQYLVDGVNTTNVIKGFQGKALSQEFIEEVQVKTSGYEPEYGRALGGVINVVTKSGGNEFHGDAFGYFDRKSWTADAKISPDSDESTIIDRTQENRDDFGADLGGFLLKDRIWFFGAYNRVSRNQDQTPLTGANGGVNLPLDFHTDIYSGKLTIRPTEATTVVGTVFGDPETREGDLANFNSTNPIVRQAIRHVGATDFAASASQLFGTLGLVNVRFSQHKDRFELEGKANGIQVVDTIANPTNPLRSGGFGTIFGPTNNNRSRRNAIRGDGTVFLATHEIKGGVDFEDNLTETTSYVTGGQIVTIRACPTSGARLCPTGVSQYYSHQFFTAGGPNGESDAASSVAGYLPGGNIANPKTKRLGLFLQDSYKPLPNVTINAGVRYDQEDVKDYTGTTVFKLKDEWQPRIGLAWDVMKDGSSKVSASYGRFYYAIPTDLNVRAYGAQLIAVTCNFDSLALDNDSGCPRAFQTQGGAFTEPVQSDIKGIYQDEVTLGFDKAIDSTFAVGIRGTYRTLGRTIEDRCDFDPGYPEANNNTCVILNPGSDSPFSTGQGVHTCSGIDYGPEPNNPPESECTGQSTTGVSIPKAKRQYFGLELVAKKQISSVLWAQASYIYSHLVGNYAGAARVGGTGLTGQTDPGINADYDYAAFSNNAYGTLALDRPHSFRLDAAYTTPFGLTVGFQGFIRSGTPVSRIGYFNSQYGPEIYLSQRGSEGRQPTDYDVNLSLGYAIKLNPITVTLFAQGFNLLNKQIVQTTEFAQTINQPGDPNEFNADYGKATARENPRSIRLGARVSF